MILVLKIDISKYQINDSIEFQKFNLLKICFLYRISFKISKRNYTMTTKFFSSVAVYLLDNKT